MPIYSFNWIDTNPEWPCMLGKDFKCIRKVMLHCDIGYQRSSAGNFSHWSCAEASIHLAWERELRLTPIIPDSGNPWAEGRVDVGFSSPLHEGPLSCTCWSVPPHQRGFLELGLKRWLPFCCLQLRGFSLPSKVQILNVWEAALLCRLSVVNRADLAYQYWHYLLLSSVNNLSTDF